MPSPASRTVAPTRVRPDPTPSPMTTARTATPTRTTSRRPADRAGERWAVHLLGRAFGGSLTAGRRSDRVGGEPATVSRWHSVAHTPPAGDRLLRGPHPQTGDRHGDRAGRVGEEVVALVVDDDE